MPAVFGRVAPVVLEIGFGMGETTLALATDDPDRDVIAVDVHTPGAGALLRALDGAGRCNVRVAVADALVVLRDLLTPQSLDEIRVFFPDPWPKARHRKRRLYSPAFAALAADRLRPGGRLHSATDWAPYAAQMLQVVDGEPLLSNAYPGFAPRPGWRPVTRFERQGLAKGHQIFDVLARRVSAV
ncbi:MAG: tRNA (guanosine(46)-N7)-methyltransferase TrmB [Kineosporiaceae bacterium]